MSRLALPLEALSVVSTAPDHVQDNILLHVTLIKPLPFFVRSGHYNDWAIPTYRYPSIYVKWSRYMPDVAQSVCRGIALLFHDRGTRRGWVVSSTLQPQFTPGKTRYPFYRRLGGPQGRSGWAENLIPTGILSRTVQPVVSRYTDWDIPAYGNPTLKVT